MSTFRQYTKDDSFNTFKNVQRTVPSLKEYQIALAFAQDYKGGKPTNGNFIPYWDTERVTVDSIIQFKNQNPNLNNVNVFISIGNRDATFPFSCTDPNEWVTNATNSITNIVKQYFQPVKDIVGIGIDVYYEQVKQQEAFIDCIGKLINNLKKGNVITLASIAPSANLLNLYQTLYDKYHQSIDSVDYQFYDEVESIADPDSFVRRYDNIAVKFPRISKLMVGYSSARNDWGTLAPVVFFIGGSIIAKTRQSHAASLWDIERDPDWALLPFGVMWYPNPPNST